MKRVLRGTLVAGETRRLLIDDGDFQHGFKVTSMQISPLNPLGEENSNATSAVLHISNAAETNFNWASPKQIAWSVYNTNPTNTLNVIDPHHVVVRELFITNLNAANALNYMIHIEDRMLTPAHGVLQMVKEVTYNE